MTYNNKYSWISHFTLKLAIQIAQIFCLKPFFHTNIIVYRFYFENFRLQYQKNTLGNAFFNEKKY